MRDRKLHLVYSSTPSDAAKSQRAVWGFENARQLQLFEDLDKIRIVLVPIAEISAHSFRQVMSEKSPILIIDTRQFPDFFSIFSTTEEAFSVFRTKGIEYKRISLGPGSTDEESWANLDALKRVLGDYLQRRAGAPVLLLTSTPKKSAELAAKVPGYLSQEVAETCLEELPR